MNSQEYQAYINGLNQTDKKNGQLYTLVGKQHSLLNKMVQLVNEYEARIYEPNARVDRSLTSKFINDITSHWEQIHKIANVIIPIANDNLDKNGLIQGKYAQFQDEYNQNAKFILEKVDYISKYADKIKSMCDTRSNLTPKTPKTLEDFYFLTSMASAYSWVKPDYRAIEDPYDRKKAQEVFFGFQREAPQFEQKVHKQKGTSWLKSESKITRPEKVEQAMDIGRRALNNPIRQITLPSHKFSKRVMRASAILREHIRRVVAYLETGQKESKHAYSPISLPEIKRVCREMIQNQEMQEK